MCQSVTHLHIYFYFDFFRKWRRSTRNCPLGTTHLITSQTSPISHQFQSHSPNIHSELLGVFVPFFKAGMHAVYWLQFIQQQQLSSPPMIPTSHSEYNNTKHPHNINTFHTTALSYTHSYPSTHTPTPHNTHTIPPPLFHNVIQDSNPPIHTPPTHHPHNPLPSTPQNASVPEHDTPPLLMRMWRAAIQAFGSANVTSTGFGGRSHVILKDSFRFTNRPSAEAIDEQVHKLLQ